MAYDHTIEVRYNNHVVEGEIDFSEKKIKFSEEVEMPMNLLGKVHSICLQVIDILSRDVTELKKLEINKK